MNIKIKRLNELAVIPKYMSRLAAGMDLSSSENITIRPGQTAVVKTGLAFELPQGVEIQIRSRSGLAAKYAVHVTNSPGTIDPDYNGEIMIILTNSGGYGFEIKVGDRIAQAVFNRFEVVNLVEFETLCESERGANGLGSTGK
jgi:dUTP pyrophosphatase